MGQAKLQTTSLLGIHMGLFEDEKLANDLTKSGVYCPSETCTGLKHEMERVSSELRFTCHWCGGVVEYDEKGNITESWFEGFK